MQIWSGQQSAGGTFSPTRKFVSTIIAVFSLAGLVIGFAVGGLTHSPGGTTNNTDPTKKPVIAAQTTVTATPTATPPPDVTLGFPQFNPYPTTPEKAAGGTQYTVTMLAVDKKKKPVHSADVTCKLWLVPQIPAGQTLDIDAKILKNVAGLSTPIAGTLNGQPMTELPYLSFTPTTPQTTKCGANGQATWNYTIAPTAVPGNYELVILADWKGVHYNWYWTDIAIK